MPSCSKGWSVPSQELESSLTPGSAEPSKNASARAKGREQSKVRATRLHDVDPTELDAPEPWPWWKLAIGYSVAALAIVAVCAIAAHALLAVLVEALW